MNKLLLSDLAKDDLQEIKAYIANDLQNPSAVLKTLKTITHKLRSLEQFPASGFPLSSVTDFFSDYRCLICGNYIAFYRTTEDTVYIDRVLYGKRNYMKVLFNLDEQS